MQKEIKALFARYEQHFNAALAGDAAPDTSFYSDELVAVGPRGPRTGKNDAQLAAVMEKGFERYRAIGTQSMRVRALKTHRIDEAHAVASVSWQAIYHSRNESLTVVDFDVHYLLEWSSGAPRIFGWIAGDEEALLREKGVI